MSTHRPRAIHAFAVSRGGRIDERVAHVFRLSLAHSAFVALLACGAAPAMAHTFTITRVCAVVRADHRMDIDMTVDVDALALGVPPSTDSAEVAARLRAMSPDDLEQAVEQARRTIAGRVFLRVDGRRVDSSIDFPDRRSPRVSEPALPTVLGVTARLTVDLPPDAKAFVFTASRAFGPVHLTILDESSAAGMRVMLAPGEASPPYALGGESAGASASGWPDTVVRYVALGFEHIVPKGVDHILFVLGLFLLSPKVRPLLWQVTAFTIAHSLTLGLALAGVVSVSPRVVEPLIAASIAAVAIENIITSRLSPWRPVVVFAFGLMHGLGFAGVLRELGLPPGGFAVALMSFNLGVEAGQLAVVLAAFATLGLLRNRIWYRSAVAVPISAVIGGVGMFWAIQRVVT